MLKPGGKLLLIGIPPTAERVTFLIDKLRHKEICIQNVRRQNHCVQTAIDMMDRNDFDVSVMVTHRFPFDKTQAAFDLAASYENGVLKAMIDFPLARKVMTLTQRAYDEYSTHNKNLF